MSVDSGLTQHFPTATQWGTYDAEVHLAMETPAGQLRLINITVRTTLGSVATQMDNHMIPGTQ